MCATDWICYRPLGSTRPRARTTGSAWFVGESTGIPETAALGGIEEGAGGTGTRESPIPRWWYRRGRCRGSGGRRSSSSRCRSRGSRCSRLGGSLEDNLGLGSSLDGLYLHILLNVRSCSGAAWVYARLDGSYTALASVLVSLTAGAISALWEPKFVRYV